MPMYCLTAMNCLPNNLGGLTMKNPYVEDFSRIHKTTPFTRYEGFNFCVRREALIFREEDNVVCYWRKRFSL